MDWTQIEREREYNMIRRGVNRWEKHQAKLEAKDKQWDAAPYSPILHEMVSLAVPAVRELQREAKRKVVGTLTSGARLAGWELDIATMDPAVIAYITARSMLIGDGDSRHVLANRVGNILRLEIQYERMTRQERVLAGEESRKNRIDALKRTVKEIGPRTVRKWLRKLDDLDEVAWKYEHRQRVGQICVEAVSKVLSDYIIRDVIHSTANRRHVSKVQYRLKTEVHDRIKAEGYRKALEQPWLLPMVCPPRPWDPQVVETNRDWGEVSGVETGGYLEIGSDLIKFSHLQAQSNKTEVNSEITDALNRVQATPWRVNKRVLAVIEQALDLELDAILPVASRRDLPRKVDDATWETMSKPERGQVIAEREAVHSHNNRLEGKRASMERAVSVAFEYEGFDRFYFPHNIDWRGRMYPLPQDLHPQADDLARGLLEFAEGKPVGATGGRWIAHAVANAFGEDKLTLDEQVRWCMGNQHHIERVAHDPLGEGLTWLSEAEEPWQFLAACLDYCGWLTDGQHHVSHLPVHVDGSCNGLQHLSAMGRDPVGAKAVNLTSDPHRHDIYQIVADKVANKVADEHFAVEQSWPWRGKVTRKTVKRAVMTTPYGVTPQGIRDQLISDRILEDIEGDRMANANYIRDLMVEAIDDTIVVGKQIMQWMQQCAGHLASEGKVIHWTSPTGLLCTQEYRRPKVKRMATLLGQVEILNRDKGGQLLRQKMIQAIAPNIVHSFDAAHLVKTVNAMPMGTSFAVVHDSYGAHACDVDTLGHHLREQFIEVYQVDWLSVYRASFASQMGIRVHGEELYDVPEEMLWLHDVQPGDFDIEEVRGSQWMFH